MMNSSLPPLPSQIFNFGDNDCRMPMLDISSTLDSKLSFDDEEMRCANFGINYFQPICETQTGYRNTSSGNMDRTEQPHRQIERDMISTHDTAQLNGRKRPLEAREQESSASAAEEKTASSEREKNNERRRRAFFSVQQPHPQAEKSSVDLRKSKATMKRSEKMGDRITALQKLVSPYGKTDTASVLQEASLYIRLLQEQIQNLFQMLSSSYSSSIRPLQQQEKGKRQTDLISRGICLVPVSSIQEVIKGTKVDDHSIHRYDH